jgi:hypothetical protein
MRIAPLALLSLALFGCARPAPQVPAVPLPPKVKIRPRAALALEAKDLTLLLEWTNAGPVHVHSSSNLLAWLQVTNTISLSYSVREPAPAFYRVWEDPTVTLAWDQSPDPSVVGYHLYWGCNSRAYTNFVDCGAATIWQLRGLATNTLYFFAATTYNWSGLESDYSAEASYTTPGYSAAPARIRKP